MVGIRALEPMDLIVEHLQLREEATYEAGMRLLLRIAQQLLKGEGDCLSVGVYTIGDVMWVMGRMYARGVGVKKDKKKAFEFYQRGAEEYHGDCLCWMAMLYELRKWHSLKPPIVEKADYSKAKIFYHHAADLGHAKAQYAFPPPPSSHTAKPTISSLL